MLMAELNGLLDEAISGRDKVRSLDRQDQRAEKADDNEQAENAGFRPCVSAFWEYLRHAIQ
jgi:hypothetical protein